jgi:DNA polymerase kappa
MISTANYVARRYGVRAAMPGFIAKKLCPELVFVHLHFDKVLAGLFMPPVAGPGCAASRVCTNSCTRPLPGRVQYREAAEQTRAVFREYDPHFSAHSLDEAYLDITDVVRRRPTRAPPTPARLLLGASSAAPALSCVCTPCDCAGLWRR